MAFITIITVCLNDLENLKKTINSLRMQSYKDFEIVVKDGGSNDGTQTYLSELTGFNLKAISGKDRGIYDAMNNGLVHATGEYVYFLNSGDTLVSAEVIERVVSKLTTKPDLAYGKVLCVSPALSYEKGRPIELADFSWGMPISHQAVFYRRASLPVPAYLKTYNLIADYQLTRTFFRTGKSVLFLDFTIANFDLSGVSSQSHFRILSERLVLARNEKSWLELIKVILLLYPKYILIFLLNKLGIYQQLNKLRPRSITGDKL